MNLRLGLVLFVFAACSKSSSPATSSRGPSTGSTDMSSATTASATGGSSQAMPMDGTEPCPNIQIKGSDSVPAGTKAEVTTTLVGGQGTASYTWSLSKGTIASGQGTPHITVDTGGLAGSTVVATVTLGGLKTECATNSATASILVGN